jgi:uncharacterized protein with PIN domain
MVKKMRSSAKLCLHGELSDFLPRKRKDPCRILFFDEGASIKDVIESSGIPHPEIDVLLVDGVSVDFSKKLHDGESIEAFPFSCSPHIIPVIHLQPPIPQTPAFILDVHLGKLTHYLRMMGFDSLYRNDFEDKEIVTLAHEQNRIILTRDRGLLKYSLVSHGYYVRSFEPQEQLREVAGRFGLCKRKHPFTICMECNGKLEPVQKQEIESLLEEKTVKYFNRFARCTSCGRIYWEGSHHGKMIKRIQEICMEDR